MNIFALLSLGLLTGNELSVGALQSPALARLEPHARVAGAQAMARSLGRVMPFWMAATLLLLAATTWRASSNKTLWGASSLVMFLVIVWTLFLPLPINNRIVLWNLSDLPSNWRDELSSFSLFHNIRVAMLLLSTVLALRAATS